MVLTFFPSSKRVEPTIRLPDTYLRPPVRADWKMWAELRAVSRDFLQPWEPTWPEDALTRSAFRRRLARYSEDWAADRGYAFFIFANDTDDLLGGITLSNVRRGVVQSCSFGYWIGRPHIRKGYMTEAVYGASRFAFEHIGLHRIEAACLPHNEASIGVLMNCGFSAEGLARKYLKINGRWQDHQQFSLLREEFFPNFNK